MASVTVNLTGYVDFIQGTSGRVRWNDNVSLGATFARTNSIQILNRLGLGYAGSQAGRVGLEFVGADDDFTDEFESNGRLIFTASDDTTLEVTIGGSDTDEPYSWRPTNETEVITFAQHVRGLADQNATLTLTDDPPVPDRPVAPTLTGTSNSITAVGMAPDDHGNTITSYDWRYKRTDTLIWGNRLDQTNLTQVFASLDPEREYEVQFLATNSEGDSLYSPSGRFTTLAVVTPPVTFTNIPTPVAGDEWDLDDFKLWIVDNIEAIHDLYTGATPGSTFSVDEVVIGAAGGAFAGVSLPDGALLIGTSGTPIALTIGSNGERFLTVNGALQWGTP